MLVPFEAPPPRRRWALRGLAVGGLASALFAGGGCDDHLIGQGVPIVNTCLRDPPLTYENTGKGLIERHCRSCHGEFRVGAQRSSAPIGVDFDDEADILVWAESIYESAVVARTMPPAGGMLEGERLRLAEWMRCEVFPMIGRFDIAGPLGEEEP